MPRGLFPMRKHVVTTTQSSKILFLKELLDVEVTEDQINKISKENYNYRQVLVRQCSAGSSKLTCLKSIINARLSGKSNIVLGRHVVEFGGRTS